MFFSSPVSMSIIAHTRDALDLWVQYSVVREQEGFDPS